MIFFLHGNAGVLDSWARIAERYTSVGYDVFLYDYRGYGKSEGRISSRQQFFDDAQAAYDFAKTRYQEPAIIIAGYSIGTGTAAKLAADNNPKRLLLHAPYFSLATLMKQNYPVIPTFLLKYNFETNRYLQTCKAPVTIFHGDKDEVIPIGNSKRLAQSFKPSDTLIQLQNQGHNGITNNRVYIRELERLLRQ